MKDYLAPFASAYLAVHLYQTRRIRHEHSYEGRSY